MRRIIPFGLAVLFLISCRKNANLRPVDRTHFLVDTAVHVTVYDDNLSEEQKQDAIDAAFREMAKFEGLVSTHVDTGEVSRIVRNAGKRPVAISTETERLIRKSIEISKISGGSFDPTLGALKILWGFNGEHPSVPSAEAVRRLLKTTGVDRIVLRNGTAFLNNPDVRLDLGGLGEGYIIDKGVEVLRSRGVRAGIVEATGDLYMFGKRPGRKFWRIGVKHPRDPGGGLIGLLEIGECGIATSGDYERYFIAGGKRYCHLLDPKNGYPATGCLSATVVAPDALTADAYATAVFVMGPEKGMELIEKRPELEGIIMVEKNGRIQQIVSKGLQSKYKPL